MNAINPQMYVERLEGIVQDATIDQLEELCEAILADSYRDEMRRGPNSANAAAIRAKMHGLVVQHLARERHRCGAALKRERDAINQTPNGRAAEQSPHGFINSQDDATAAAACS